MATKWIGMGMAALVLVGCAQPAGVMPGAVSRSLPAGPLMAYSASQTAKGSFTVSPTVRGYTADAVTKAAAALRSRYGNNAKSLRDSRLFVSVHVVAEPHPVFSYDVTGDFASLLGKAATNDDARAVLDKATVTMAYPLSNNAGGLDRIPTFSASGGTVVYFLKVTAQGPVGSRGERPKVAETFISDFGRNFRATVT